MYTKLKEFIFSSRDAMHYSLLFAKKYLWLELIKLLLSQSVPRIKKSENSENHGYTNEILNNENSDDGKSFHFYSIAIHKLHSDRYIFFKCNHL